jgi:hypothetical protein
MSSRVRFGNSGVSGLPRRPLRLRDTLVALIGLAVVGVGGFAWAVWTGSEARPYEFASADSVGSGIEPTVSPSGSTATVSWTVSTLSSGAAVTGYDVARYDVGGVSQTVNAGCAGTISASTCTENDVPDGTWQYTVTPRIGLWLGTESPKSTQATVGTTKLVFTTPARSTIAGVSTEFVSVERQDANGVATTVGGFTVNLATTSGTGTFRNSGDTTIVTSITIPNGASAATLRYRDTVSGTATLTASAPSAPAVTSATQTVTVSSAAAHHLSFTQQASNSVAGSVFATQPTVSVRDSFDNTVSTATNSVTLAVATGPGSVLCTSNTVAAISGSVGFVGCAIATSGTYTLQTTAVGLASATSQPLVISTGAASRLSFGVQPSNTTAGLAVSPALTVRVEDGFGNLVTTATPPVALTFAANPGPGTLAGTVSTNAVAGVATFSNVSISKAATGYTLAASSGSLTSATSNPFSITAAAADHLVYAQQPTTAASAAAIIPAVRVQIVDQYGNRTGSAAHVIVALSTNPSAGTLSGTTDVAAVAGEATFSDLKIDKTGTGYVLRATSGTLLLADSTPFNITPGAAVRIAFLAQPTSAAAGASLGTITVQVKDAAGNVVTGSTATVTLAIGNNAGGIGATLAGTTSVNAIVGVATFSNVSLNTAANGYTLSASASGLTGDTSTAFNVTAGAANRVKFSVQPTNSVAGVVINPAATVRIEDAFGNLTTSGADVTVALTTPGAAVLSGTALQPAAAGLAAFANLSVNKVGTYTLTASSAGLTSDVSGSFTVSAAAASSLSFSTQPPTTLQAGATFSPAVRVLDAFANPVQGLSVVLSVTSNPVVGFTCTSTTSIASDATGTATFAGCTVTKTGSYTLTATTSGPSLTVVSSGLTVTSAPAASVSFSVQPSTPTTAGVAITTQPSVLVTDTYANPVTGSSVTLSVTGNPAVGFTCTATSVSTNGSGVAAFAGCTLTKAGTFTFTATTLVPTTLTAQSASFVINAAALNALSFTPSPSTPTVAGTAFSTQPAVTALDSFGNPVSAQSVVLTVTGNPAIGFTCDATTVSTAVNTGIAAFVNCKANIPGTYTLLVTSGIKTATSGSFTINTGPAVSVAFTATPGGSTTVAGNIFATQPIVKVADSVGNGVGSIPVTLTVTGQSAAAVGFTCTSTSVTSAAGTGLASFGACRVTKVGTYTLTASTTSPILSVATTNFTINAAPASALKITDCVVNGGAVTCGPTHALGTNGTLVFKVTLMDAFGNVAVSNANVAISASSPDTSKATVSPTAPATLTVVASASVSGNFTVTKLGNPNNSVTITVSSTGGFVASTSIDVTKT